MSDENPLGLFIEISNIENEQGRTRFIQVERKTAMMRPKKISGEFLGQ